MEPRIPFTVIGGYLGAGKTTLLNHILRHSAGRRLALLINDFGSINIDAELIESEDGDVVNLANGCICCSLAAGFVVAINTVLQQDPLPDHVIVEASGVSDPSKIARYGQTPGFSLDGVIVVADAETVQDKAVDRYVGRTVMQQLKSADLIVLNKVDLVSTGEEQAVRDWLAQAAPQCRIYETRQGVVPLELLLGLDATGEAAPPAREVGDAGHDHAGDDQDGPRFVTWSYVGDAPLERRSFERFLNSVPEAVVRGKGFVHLQDDAERRTVFQLAGRRWALSPGRPWGDEKPQSRIVWIGFSDQFERDSMDAALRNCIIQAANGEAVQ